eukprot:14433496-Alexandrium_andersonii.AAC.1
MAPPGMLKLEFKSLHQRQCLSLRLVPINVRPPLAVGGDVRIDGNLDEGRMRVELGLGATELVLVSVKGHAPRFHATLEDAHAEPANVASGRSVIPGCVPPPHVLDNA